MCPWEPGQGDSTTLEPKDPVSLEEFGAPVPGQAFTDSFNPYDYTLVPGPDGLPVEDSPPWQSQDNAPIPLTPETVSCLPQPKDKWNPEGLPACQFYKRKRVHNPEAPDKPIIMRFCTVPSLRGINGACLSLDDAGIFDCEFRKPVHPRAKAVLDRIDREKIVRGRERLVEERKTGKVHGYRMFRTPEDVAAGRFVLEDGDTQTGELSRPRPDPMADDDPPPPAQGEGK